MKISKFMTQNSRFFIAYPIVLILTIMALMLLQDRSWFLGFFFLISASLLIYIYGISKKIPGKYLLPGVLLLILFQVYPAVYSGFVAFTNDSNGHQISKEQAIEAIIDDSKIPSENSAPVPFKGAIKDSSEELYIVFEYPATQVWISNGLKTDSVPESQIIRSNETEINQIAGFQILSDSEFTRYASEAQEIQISMPGNIYLQLADFENLEIYEPSLSYSGARDEIVDKLSGVIYRPNDNGQMESSDGQVLYPGWKANVGIKNFSSVVTNEEIRRPILAVLTWTFVNAFFVVTTGFLMGLVLALIFNFPQMRSKRFYRTVFIIPMAIPSVLSFLVWAGLFTTETGVIDRIFGLSTPWLTDAFWARIAVLIVELWITFPYMFLITTGAIQSIPGEILEAAEIDGASPIKSFRLIKLPLVMRTVAPLLVASGAMALNNFGAIYLLTGGGPTFANSNGNAGATDILISYTYKLAFNSQEGNNYGLASALSILNFILVGSLSIYGFRRMKTMEGVN